MLSLSCDRLTHFIYEWRVAVKFTKAQLPEIVTFCVD